MLCCKGAHATMGSYFTLLEVAQILLTQRKTIVPVCSRLVHSPKNYVYIARMLFPPIFPIFPPHCSPADLTPKPVLLFCFPFCIFASLHLRSEPNHPPSGENQTMDQAMESRTAIFGTYKLQTAILAQGKKWQCLE